MTRPILKLKTPRQPVVAAPPPAPLPASYVAPMALRIEDILAELEPLFEPTGPRMLPWFPYAIGIVEALLGDPRFKPGADPEAAREFVRRTIMRVTNCGAYLRALARPGAQRHDITGDPVEAVSDAHREHALRKLEERARRRATRSPELPILGQRAALALLRLRGPLIASTAPPGTGPGAVRTPPAGRRIDDEA